MPIYEYRCEQCGHRFDAWLRSMQSAEPDRCPSCGQPAVRRLPSLTTAAARSGASGGESCAPSGAT